MAAQIEVKGERQGMKPGPVSMKGISHLAVHPAFDGKVAVQHHYEDYSKSPVTKKFEPAAAVKHIANFLGVAHEEPGGKNPREEAQGQIEDYGRSEAEEKGQD